jgi:NosR/NirI family transcriptional regulator, nitrous oxide reductase regulator
MVPLFIGIGGWTGSRIYESLARVNSKVRLADELLQSGTKKTTVESLEITSFKSSGKTTDQLFTEVRVILRQFYIGGWILGGFLGLVFGVVLARMMLSRYQTDYIPDKYGCLSCARCIDYCPVKPK